jgi:hypothetical protein
MLVNTIAFLLCHVLLSMGPVRRFFGLDPEPERALFQGFARPELKMLLVHAP